MILELIWRGRQSIFWASGLFLDKSPVARELEPSQKSSIGWIGLCMCKILKKSGAISRIKTEGVKKIHYKNFIKIPRTTTIGGSDSLHKCTYALRKIYR